MFQAIKCFLEGNRCYSSVSVDLDKKDEDHPTKMIKAWVEHVELVADQVNQLSVDVIKNLLQEFYKIPFEKFTYRELDGYVKAPICRLYAIAPSPGLMIILKQNWPKKEEAMYAMSHLKEVIPIWISESPNPPIADLNDSGWAQPIRNGKGARARKVSSSRDPL